MWFIDIFAYRFKHLVLKCTTFTSVCKEWAISSLTIDRKLPICLPRKPLNTANERSWVGGIVRAGAVRILSFQQVHQESFRWTPIGIELQLTILTFQQERGARGIPNKVCSATYGSNSAAVLWHALLAPHCDAVSNLFVSIEFLCQIGKQKETNSKRNQEKILLHGNDGPAMFYSKG